VRNSKKLEKPSEKEPLVGRGLSYLQITGTRRQKRK
jgi:hypothetical protein